MTTHRLFYKHMAIVLAIVVAFSTLQVTAFAQDEVSPLSIGEIVAIEPLGNDVQTVAFGTELLELNLPTVLNATIRISFEAEPEMDLELELDENEEKEEAEETEETTVPAIGWEEYPETPEEAPILAVADLPINIEGVTWESYPAFDPYVSGYFGFTAVLPERYVLADGVTLPVVTVFVAPVDVVPMVVPVTFSTHGLPPVGTFLAPVGIVPDYAIPISNEVQLRACSESSQWNKNIV